MTFYWQGHLALDDGLLPRFYARASVADRTEVIEFIGRSLWNTKGEINSDIQARLVALWNSRLTAVQNTV